LNYEIKASEDHFLRPGAGQIELAKITSHDYNRLHDITPYNNTGFRWT